MVTVFTLFPGHYISVEGRGSEAKRRYYKTFRKNPKTLYYMESTEFPKWEQYGYLTTWLDSGKVVVAKKVVC